MDLVLLFCAIQYLNVVSCLLPSTGVAQTGKKRKDFIGYCSEYTVNGTLMMAKYKILMLTVIFSMSGAL